MDYDEYDDRWPEERTHLVNCFSAENDHIYLITKNSIYVLNESIEYLKEIRFKKLYDAVGPDVDFTTCCTNDIGIENNNSYLLGCNAKGYPDVDKPHAWLIKFALDDGGEDERAPGDLDFKKKLRLTDDQQTGYIDSICEYA